LAVIFPSASTSVAPKDWKTAPTVSTESVVVPRPIPNGTPALWHASAALRKASSVQSSALGGCPAGYMACTSMPACFFIRSMRVHGPLMLEPGVEGTASQCPSARARYLTVSFTAPFCLISGSTMSSTGVKFFAYSCGHHVRMFKMSWPDFDCDSMAAVISSFSPFEVM
jgi:hypothetical protein